MRILFFIYLSFTAFSQELIEGNIKDSKGNIIPGANIYISSTKEVLYANFKGNFYIKSPSENFKIYISHVGYITKEITIISNEKKYYEVVLEDGILLSDEIKVTSTRVKENSPFAFSNISRNFIEENNIGREYPCHYYFPQ